MSDPDDEVGEPPPGPLARATLPLLRVAITIGALAAIAVGAERIHAGAGYLAAGLLVWLELARAGRRGPPEEQP